jgi:hypothetical protein
MVALMVTTSLALHHRRRRHRDGYPPIPGDPPPPPGEDPRDPRPDIVVLVLDDIPELDGRLWSRLPNIRRLFVEQGLELTDTHGETPTCCPGRAGFLTGLHTHHHGAYRTMARCSSRETIATALHGSAITPSGGQYIEPLRARLPKWPPAGTGSTAGGAYYGYTLWSDGVPHGTAAAHATTRPMHRQAHGPGLDVSARPAALRLGHPYSMDKPGPSRRDIGRRRAATCRAGGPGHMERT